MNTHAFMRSRIKLYWYGHALMSRSWRASEVRLAGPSWIISLGMVVRSVYSRDGFPGSFMLALSRLSAGFPGGDDPGRIINSPCSEVGAGHTQSPKVEGVTYPVGKLVLVPCDLLHKLTCERS